MTTTNQAYQLPLEKMKSKHTIYYNPFIILFTNESLGMNCFLIVIQCHIGKPSKYFFSILPRRTSLWHTYSSGTWVETVNIEMIFRKGKLVWLSYLVTWANLRFYLSNECYSLEKSMFRLIYSYYLVLIYLSSHIL